MNIYDFVEKFHWCLYQWLSAGLSYLQCVSNEDATVVRSPIDVILGLGNLINCLTSKFQFSISNFIICRCFRDIYKNSQWVDFLRNDEWHPTLSLRCKLHSFASTALFSVSIFLCNAVFIHGIIHVFTVPCTIKCLFHFNLWYYIWLKKAYHTYSMSHSNSVSRPYWSNLWRFTFHHIAWIWISVLSVASESCSMPDISYAQPASNITT